MGDFLQLLLNKEIFTKKIPVWHILILGCGLMAWVRLGHVSDGVDDAQSGIRNANRMLEQHGDHLDRIDSALYYKFNIDTAPQQFRSPRQSGSIESTNNINIAKTP